MKIYFQNAILLVLCLCVLFSVFCLSSHVLAVDTLYSLSSSDGRVNIGSSRVSTDFPGTLYLYMCQPSNYLAVLFESSTPPSSQSYRLSIYRAGGALETNEWLSNAHAISGHSNMYSFVTSTRPADGYSSLASMTEADAISLWLTPPAPPVNPTPLEYSLPPGNVAYIPIPSGQSSSISYTLTTTYYMAFGNNDSSRINQVVTVMSSLPSSSNNVAPSSPKIPWINNGNVNLLGVSANKIYQGSIPSNLGGQYLVVVNPMTMPSQSGSIGGDTYTNGSIYISVSATSGAPHIYPMSESLTITPGDGIGSESSYGDSGYTYSVDPETGEIIWSDPSGGNTAPVAGGNNPMPSPNSIFDWLRNISQQLSDFLRGPVQAVQVVVSAIREFMGSFTQLYSWLPSPVYSLISSALMIALTIGVIKIFV